jgi:hypothetical protein
MLFTPKLVVPERVGRGMAWLFVALMGAALVTSLGFQSGLEPAGPPMAAGADGLAHGVSMLADVVDSAWRETLREVTTVVVAVLDWNWWPLQAAMNLLHGGGAHVLHS